MRRVDVACPGFTSDCLETLEEIAQEGRDAFLGRRQGSSTTSLPERRSGLDPRPGEIAAAAPGRLADGQAPDAQALAASRAAASLGALR